MRRACQQSLPDGASQRYFAISLFPMVLRSGTSRSACLLRRAAQKQLRSGGPASCLFPMALCRSAPGQLLPPAARTRSSATAPTASNTSASAPRPATNLIWRRRSPVWLAIWRTWAGFANSQHRDAAFATPDNICAHSSLLPHRTAAQTLANLSAHLHRLPTPPPYLRQMRLLRGLGAGMSCWMWLPPDRVQVLDAR